MKNILRFFCILFLIVLVACTPASGASEGTTSKEPAAELPAEKPTVDPDKPANSEEAAPRPGNIPVSQDGMLVQEAQVLSFDIRILESFPVQIHVAVTGVLADGCTSPGPIVVEREGDAFLVTVQTTRPADRMCTQVVSNFSETVPLDVQDLPAGTYTVIVNGVVGSFELTMDNKLPTGDGN